MSLKYVLTQAGNKIGLDPSEPSQRSVLLRYANEAADEMYTQADVDGSLVEQVFKVNGDQTISLPEYVGRVRAMREYYSQIPWHVRQLRPRYNVANWQDGWRGFRLKGKQALQATITNQSQVVVTVATVEDPPVVVSLSGSTDTAALVSEQITMTTTQMLSVNEYNDLTAVKKDRVNSVNVVVSDVDGKLLTTIPNNRLQALYQIIDVSMSPWLPQSNSTQDHWLEILYKMPLPWFSGDDDEFPVPGYDNAWVNKVMQLYSEEQGKGDQAAAYDAKATRTMARILEDQNKATEDCVSLVPNPHDTLMPRIRPRRPGRYRSGYMGRYGAI